MVLNLSRGGLFVQTSAAPRPGAEVWLDLNLATRSETVPIGARVVWRRAVAPHLRTVSQGGFGVQIRSAPETYFRLLSDLVGDAPAIAPPARRPEPQPAAGPRPDSSVSEFRVRLKQEGGPRSRALTVRCGSESEARELALERVGGGWVVLGLERTG
jgi:hypothetical protein